MRSANEQEGGSPSEEKKKRRFSFSSQFRRASRSRSRPSSIALPSTTPSSFFGTTPTTTPPRELHQFLMGERRPNSFHAPDSWSEVPPPALNEYFGSTPSRSSPESRLRLGILPSPAKSDFLHQEREEEREHVPPVPPIPHDVAVKHYRRRSSQDSNSHRILQSVIRHATPPVVPSRHDTPSAGFKVPKPLARNPVFADDDNDDDTEAGAQGRVDGYKVLLSTPKGSFQPDMPTAESQDPRSSSFQFGFGDEGAIKRQDEDEDDLPPQLNHDPLPAALPPYQTSPYMPTDKHMDVSDDDSDLKPIRAEDTSSLLAPSVGQNIDDISPKLPPVESTQVDVSESSSRLRTAEGNERSQEPKFVSVGDTSLVLTRLQTDSFTTQHEQHAPSGNDSNQGRHSGIVHTSHEQRRSAYETEVVGAGDVSPVSTGRQQVEDDDATAKAEKSDAGRAFSPVWFTKSSLRLPKTLTRHNEDADLSHNPGSTSIGEIALSNQLSNQQPEATRAGDSLSSPAGPKADTRTRRVSASSLEAVRDVQAYPAANSSRASWDRDDLVARSRIDAGDPNKMRDESDPNAPQAQIPRITHGPSTPNAEELHDNTHNEIPNGYFRGHGNYPDFKNQAQQLQASNSAMTVPERSRSMLSQISAMVSDEGSHPYSPTSTGRSTPSTIRRMQPDSSMRTSGAPAQIPEETLIAADDRMPTREDNDFDLYADHNGIVKDVQDESGQPLRLTDSQVPGLTQQPQAIKPTVPSSEIAPGSRDEERPRLSEDRPMSFVSGQDQINQAASPLNHPQHRQQFQQHNPPPMGTVYSAHPPTRVVVQPSNQTDAQYHSTPASTLPKNIIQAMKSINPSNLAKDASTTFPPTGEPMPHQGYYVGANANDRVPQNGLGSEPGSYDIQARGMGSTPPMPNSAPVHRQTTIPTQYTASQGAENQRPTGSSQLPDQNAHRPQEKSVSKPRLSSMFKSFGAKPQQSAQQQSGASSDPSFKPLPVEPNRQPAVYAGVGRPSLSGDRFVGRSDEQIGSFVPPNRPSQSIQVSQDPTRVQPTGSRLDTRKPVTHMPHQGIPPQQPPPMPSGQPQRPSASPPIMTESGKKKRFSTFGALFGRSGGSDDGTTPKLSKEEKKAQKAQRSSASSPGHRLASQWRPQQPQQQQHIPQQPGLAYYPPGQLPYVTSMYALNVRHKLTSYTNLKTTHNTRCAAHSSTVCIFSGNVAYGSPDRSRYAFAKATPANSAAATGTTPTVDISSTCFCVPQHKAISRRTSGSPKGYTITSTCRPEHRCWHTIYQYVLWSRPSIYPPDKFRSSARRLL
jgi:hypothetical protein